MRVEPEVVSGRGRSMSTMWVALAKCARGPGVDDVLGRTAAAMALSLFQLRHTDFSVGTRTGTHTHTSCCSVVKLPGL